jgi:hypothetical protein
LINDHTTTWRQFLTPLLGPLAGHLPDLGSDELNRLHAARRTGVGTVLRAVASSSEVRAAVKELPLIGPVAQRWWRRRPPAARGTAGGDQGALPRVPPAWLHDLFGPTTTRFSAQAARAVLHWSARTDQDSAMAQTIQWLTAVGLRPAAGDLAEIPVHQR